MFKQYLIITIVLVILIVITYLVVNYYLIKTHKIVTTSSKVKYKMNKRDYEYLKKYSTKTVFEESISIFYINEKWSTKNNNYILFENDYYIIEPGYYYYINENVKTFFNENFTVFKLN